MAATKPVTPWPFAAGVQFAAGGEVGHAHREQGFEAAGLAVEQADLDEVEAEQVLHVAGDVVLEEVLALLDAHLGEFVGGEVGEFLAGLVDGVDLLLLKDLGGDLAGQGDELGGVAGGVEDGGDGQSEEAVRLQAEDGAGRPPVAQGGGERAGFGAEDLGGAEGLVEPHLGRIDAGGDQALELGVGPEDLGLGVGHGDAVGDGVEDLVGLDQEPGPADGLEQAGIDEDAVEGLLPEQDEGAGHGPGHDDVEVLGQVLPRLRVRTPLALDDQHATLLGHTTPGSLVGLDPLGPVGPWVEDRRDLPIHLHPNFSSARPAR